MNDFYTMNFFKPDNDSNLIFEDFLADSDEDAITQMAKRLPEMQAKKEIKAGDHISLCWGHQDDHTPPFASISAKGDVNRLEDIITRKDEFVCKGFEPVRY